MNWSERWIRNGCLRRECRACTALNKSRRIIPQQTGKQPCKRRRGRHHETRLILSCTAAPEAESTFRAYALPNGLSDGRSVNSPAALLHGSLLESH